MKMMARATSTVKCLTAENRLSRIRFKRKLPKLFRSARKTTPCLVILNSLLMTSLCIKISQILLSMQRILQKWNGNALMKLLQMRQCLLKMVLHLETLSREFSATAGYLVPSLSSLLTETSYRILLFTTVLNTVSPFSSSLRTAVGNM